jgi:hypothetical protein
MKSFVFTLLFIASKLLLFGQYQKHQVYYDDFTDNRNQWPTEATTGKSEYSIYSGNYYFEHKLEKYSWITSKIIELNESKDFEIEARITKISGIQNNGFGIVWGRKDSYNQFDFYISANGYYKINKSMNSNRYDMVPWTKSSFVNKGNGATNTLTIRKLGNSLKFYLNGNFLTEKPYQYFFGDRIGFVIYKNQKIAIDYLSVAYIEEQPKNQVIAKQFTFVSDVDKDIPVTQTKQTSTYALIIGNEDYSSQQKGLTTEQNVDFAENDAAIFAEYCEKTLGVPGKQIKMLTNATTAEIYQGVAWLSNLSRIERGNAKLIFYYSGHGLPHEQTKEAYIMPVDVSGNHVEFAVKVNDVYKKLTEHPARQVTVFLDACFSGGARNQGLIAMKGVKIAPKENQVSGNLVVFSSSTGQESSAVYTEKQHGYFTYFLLKKLKETRGDITFEALSDYLVHSVSKETALNGKVQTPQVNVSPQVASRWGTWKLK